ncbi:MAG: tetratricopeptide repeat protein [Burkholderiales bacterium]|nr:tetratricopeptide repeat protein [Burkholderiales bacterium]
MTRALRTLTCLLFLSFAAASGPATADDFQEARRLFTQGSYGSALDRTDAILAKQPKDARARFLKGLILTEQGKEGEAIKVFTALTQDFPELPEPYNNLAVLYAAQGQDEKARTALEMAIRTHPSYATAHENLGDVYAKMAREAYDKALKLDSSNATARAKLALVKELFSARPGGAVLVKGSVAEPVVTGPKVTPESPTQPAMPPAAAVEPPPPPKPVVAPPAAKPAPESKPTPAVKPGDTDPQEEVLKTVDGWAKAWSAGDAKTYLGFYGPGFKPPAGQTRVAWEQSRRDRVMKGKRIVVQVAQPRITFASPEEAIVTFRQNYQSETLKTSSMKKLTLVRTGGRWLIQREDIGK